MEQVNKSVLIFDGSCNLCNGVVRWLLRVAPEDLFHFVPFQTEDGQRWLQHFGFPAHDLETVILIDNRTAYTHSDGFLRIVARLPRLKYVAALLGFIPRILRDHVYKVAAKNRVRWFGKSEHCAID